MSSLRGLNIPCYSVKSFRGEAIGDGIDKANDSDLNLDCVVDKILGKTSSERVNFILEGEMMYQ